MITVLCHVTVAEFAPQPAAVGGGWMPASGRGVDVVALREDAVLDDPIGGRSWLPGTDRSKPSLERVDIVLRCKRCRTEVRCRSEHLDEILDKLHAAGVSEVTLEAVQRIVTSS